MNRIKVDRGNLFIMNYFSESSCSPLLTVEGIMPYYIVSPGYPNAYFKYVVFFLLSCTIL